MKVHHRERATGVDSRLLTFLDWWEVHGPFPLVVLEKGGVRTDSEAQADLFRRGASNAKTLEETPHGRGGALDVAPRIDGQVPWKDVERFRTLGLIAELHGLEWGGRWTKPIDMDHLQVPDWKTLPFPPSASPSANVMNSS